MTTFLEASGFQIISLSQKKKEPQPLLDYSLPEQILMKDWLKPEYTPRYLANDYSPVTFAWPKGERVERPTLSGVDDNEYLVPMFDRTKVEENRLFIELCKQTLTTEMHMPTDEILPQMNEGMRAIEKTPWRMSCQNIVVGPNTLYKLRCTGHLTESSNPHAFGKFWGSNIFVTDWLHRNGALFFAGDAYVGVMPIRMPDNREIGLSIHNNMGLAYVQAESDGRR